MVQLTLYADVCMTPEQRRRCYKRRAVAPVIQLKLNFESDNFRRDDGEVNNYTTADYSEPNPQLKH